MSSPAWRRPPNLLRPTARNSRSRSRQLLIVKFLNSYHTNNVSLCTLNCQPLPDPLTSAQPRGVQPSKPPPYEALCPAPGTPDPQQSHQTQRLRLPARLQPS